MIETSGLGLITSLEKGRTIYKSLLKEITETDTLEIIVPCVPGNFWPTLRCRLRGTHHSKGGDKSQELGAIVFLSESMTKRVIRLRDFLNQVVCLGIPQGWQDPLFLCVYSQM